IDHIGQGGFCLVLVCTGMQVTGDFVELPKQALDLRGILLRNSLSGIFFACHELPPSQQGQPSHFRLVFVLNMSRTACTISRSGLIRSAFSSSACARRRSSLSIYTVASRACK